MEPFADFRFKVKLDVARAQSAKDSFTLNGSFRLGLGSNGADPAREEVELRVGLFHVVLPPGSFDRADDGEEGTLWVYNDHEHGLTHLALLQNGAAWALQAGAHKVDLSGTANPIAVALRIGDDIAVRSRYFGIFPGPQKVIFRFPPGADRDADDDGALRDADDCDDQNPAVHPGAEERCNSIDDDCDAEVDEGFVLGGSCSAGVGACERSGVTVCSPDGAGTVCGATPGEPQPETCDGRDDDCDGVSDDGFDAGAPCTVGIGACARSGVKICTPDAAGTSCDAIPGLPAAETCNGLDDDCDGAADEELGELRCGVGLCARTAPACLSGQSQVCVPAEPVAEICGNGLDEDCDGADLACPALAMAIAEPASLATVTRSPVTVAGTTSDEAVEVECAGVPAALTAAGDGRRFEASVPLREGRNTVTCRGLDARGSVGTATVVVTLDSTPPVVVLETPRDGLVTSEPAVTVVGSFNDAIAGAFDSTAVAVSCNGLPAAVEHRTFVVRNLPLRPGANAIRCTAIDPAGNAAETAARSVTRLDLAGQRIERLAGDDQSGEVGALLLQPLAVRLVDAVGLPVPGRTVTFRVSCGSGVLGDGASEERQLGVTTDATGRAAVAFRLGGRAGAGDHRVTAKALGFVGEVEFAATARSGAPERILAVGGEAQRGTAGTPLPMPLVALVVDAEGNPVEGMPVSFAVARGDGAINGEAQATVATGANGRASVTLRLGADDGINNNLVEARFSGLAGLAAVFTASGLAPGRPEDTRFTGVVLDNANLPIPGAAVSIKGTALATTTDEQGFFRLDGVPVGTVVLRVDGNAGPRPETFSVLEFEVTTVAGRENTVGMPILIPALDTTSARRCGGATPCTLMMANVPGLTLTIAPNSVTFRDGSREGEVMLTQVHLDKVPMPPPDGGLLIPAWTIQPGGTHFDPPAAITIPNTAGLPPGERAEIFQFDHDINDFVTVGTGTVSEDGAVVVSDPGYGITQAGWGGFRPPPPPIGRLTGSVGGPSPPPPPPPPDCNGIPLGPGQGCCNGTTKYDLGTQCCGPAGVVAKSSPIADLAQCPSRARNPQHVPSVNGCSSVLDNPNFFDALTNPLLVPCLLPGEAPSFKPACDLHDLCYDHCNSGKPNCDAAFLFNLLSLCSRVINPVCLANCQLNAVKYSSATAIVALSAYESAQKNACQCCP
ncbi:MAG TPA: MopE-related protein [Thermoanaerobaculia bacterium]